jgi:hypothetical protein
MGHQFNVSRKIAAVESIREMLYHVWPLLVRVARIANELNIVGSHAEGMQSSHTPTHNELLL